MLRITVEWGGARRLEWRESTGLLPWSVSWEDSRSRGGIASGNASGARASGSSPLFTLKVLDWLEIVGPSRLS